jgi:adenosylmethionine-8-amino-7-oxononanoate aminotransferase
VIGSLLHRDWRRHYPVVARASGSYLEDTDGHRYLDAVGGAYALSIGHGVKEVIDAIAAQANQVAFPYTGTFTTQAELDLAEEIIGMAPQGMHSVYFCSGGSEANEVAFKIARKYQLLRDRPERWRIVGRWQSFHGATLATLSATGHTGRRAEFLPYLLDFPHIDQPTCYRCPLQLSYPSCELACAEQLERTIALEGAASLAAFIGEPILGAAGGGAVPPDGYYERIREICDAHDLVFIADEVITGFGRTGANFAIDHYGVTPDVITCGKGISSGYLPLAAVIVHERIIEAFETSGSSAVFTGYTYSGHPVSCAAGLAVLRYIREHDLVTRARNEGERFIERMRGLARHETVGDVRGKGLLVGVELVADTTTKRPFPAETGFARRVVRYAWERGMVLHPMAGTLDGLVGEHLLLAPPLTTTREELNEIVEILDESLGLAEASLRS